MKLNFAVKAILFLVDISIAGFSDAATVTTGAGNGGLFPAVYCDSSASSSLTLTSASQTTLPCQNSAALCINNAGTNYYCSLSLDGNGNFTGSPNPGTCGTIMTATNFNLAFITTGNIARLFSQDTSGLCGSGAGPASVTMPTPTAAATGPTTATVTFGAATGGTSPYTYSVSATPANSGPSVNQAGTSPVALTGLTASTTYSVTVTATDSAQPTANVAASSAVNFTTTAIPAPPPPGPKLGVSLGVDYAPSHYIQGDPRNDEGEANVHDEMQQLKEAGFDTVRLYGDPAKVWIAVINVADKLGMNVVYQLALCESNPNNGDQCVNDAAGNTYQTVEKAALKQLADVYKVVGKDKFNKVVKLIIVGNEILYTDNSTSNASDIAGSITKVSALKYGIPISISLQGDVWIGGGPSAQGSVVYNALQTITNALPAGSYIGVNNYPFQWKVEWMPTGVVANCPQNTLSSNTTNYVMNTQAIHGLANTHSLPYYISQIQSYFPTHSVMIAESGWASQGQYNFGCNSDITGDLGSASQYYPLLYCYAQNAKASGLGVDCDPISAQISAPGSDIPLLTFMAFDAPTKVPSGSNMNSENHYGVFDHECKSKSAALIPSASYTDGQWQGCNANQSLFTFGGQDPKSGTQQPPFWLQITRGSGGANRGSGFSGQVFTVAVPTEDRTIKKEAVTPWPTVTLNVGDSVVISNEDPSKFDGQQVTCSNTVSTLVSTHQGGTWSTPNGTGNGCQTAQGNVKWSPTSPPNEVQNIIIPIDFGTAGKQLKIWSAPAAVGAGTSVTVNGVQTSLTSQTTVAVSENASMVFVVNCSPNGTLTCNATYTLENGVQSTGDPSQPACFVPGQNSVPYSPYNGFTWGGGTGVQSFNLGLPVCSPG